jgi:hypothetical protein
VYIPAPTNDFYPNQDDNRSWAYDVELGAHQLIPTGVLEAGSPEVARLMDHMEDVHFLAEGWHDYPAAASRKDWFNRGGFSKVQPYYTRNAEIYALRDEVKPFIRSYFNTIPSLLSTEVLSFWEHFNNEGVWNKTHETGYFLHQTRSMFVTERGEELWLAPFIPQAWMKDGLAVSVANAPTKFGPVSYRIRSRAGQNAIEAEIDPPQRGEPREIVIRLRHPEGRAMRAVTVNGAPHKNFDAARECVRIEPTREKIVLKAEY